MVRSIDPLSLANHYLLTLIPTAFPSGGAIADVLFGDYNPSGKLSQTFPVKLQDSPGFLGFP